MGQELSTCAEDACGGEIVESQSESTSSLATTENSDRWKDILKKHLRKTILCQKAQYPSESECYNLTNGEDDDLVFSNSNDDEISSSSN